MSTRYTDAPPGPWYLVCEGNELMVECARLGGPLGLALEPWPATDPLREAGTRLREGASVVLALRTAPPPEALVALAEASLAGGAPVVLAVLGPGRDARALATDLGIVTVAELRPLLSAGALIAAGSTQPWAASVRHLAEPDRTRIEGVLGTAERGAGHWTREDDGLLGWTDGDTQVKRIGEPPDVAAAVRAMRDADGPRSRGASILQGVDEDAVLELLFGPPRPLSDPASKAALLPYGIPVPVEELCTSASRAASEAGRIGFPVRIALASPDLRVWDHPDLAVDGVDTAARVRDVFRQVMTLAKSRARSARLLGVTVTATTVARALLSVRATPLPSGLVLAEIGFADPHGVAADDRTVTALPAPLPRLSRVFERLAGHPLLLEGGPAQRRETIEALGDALLRLAAFVDDRRAEVESVEISPLAVLVGGGVEVREACVTVSDAFQRSLAEGRPS